MTQLEGQFILELYGKYSRALQRFAMRQIGDTYLADDLVEETYLTAILRVGELLEHPNPERWLYRVLMNKCLHEYRRQGRSLEDPMIDEDYPDPAAYPSGGLFNILPKGLSRRDSDLLIWRFQEGVEFIIIAKRLGISEAAARKRVNRAVERCRRLLTGPSAVCE